MGHVVFSEGAFVDPSEILAVVVWKKPTLVSEICSSVGLAIY